jgi:hypothetical protein
MSDTWPFILHNAIHKKTITKKPLVILYFPLTGGEFLAKILSCCDEFYGSDYFDFLEKYYKSSDDDWLATYENGHHDSIFPAHARYHTFDEWFGFENIIYIDYSLSEIETDWLKLRKSFIKNSVSNDLFADLQIRYEKELISYFKNNNKKYFNFPLSSFLNGIDFANAVNECILGYGLTPLDTIKVKKIWKQWMNLNMKKAKNA